ncbi:unnamed protein product [Heligmosomoides polygyrus]|uniref:Uncharacterized protein n=1 Tax=Heligmosomoides polygyrus TaxID=6339 RepID=A0A183G7Q8_HELPZ|nr:unnamed protein product [Heligmosomoides polygyrus]
MDTSFPLFSLPRFPHAISSVKRRTASGPDRIRPELLKNLPPALINTLARLFTRYLSDGVQGSISLEDQQDRLAVQEGRRARHWQLSPDIPAVRNLQAVHSRHPE